jgi:GxxExxY protein
VNVNHVTGEIVRAAIAVHRTLGPGLLESAYRVCLAHELVRRGLRVQSERPLPVHYHGVQIAAGFRIDLLVEDAVIVELKSVEKLLPLHGAQLLSYLRLSGRHVGLLINFNVPLLRRGIRRIVNQLREN